MGAAIVIEVLLAGKGEFVEEEAEGEVGVVFFFSSRRRHTRWTGDWSSDVCSSDLTNRAASLNCRDRLQQDATLLLSASDMTRARRRDLPRQRVHRRLADSRCRAPAEIGRASCRERV